MGRDSLQLILYLFADLQAIDEFVQGSFCDAFFAACQ
jgi:hypothetical protein